jgi:hypothetical protein
MHITYANDWFQEIAFKIFSDRICRTNRIFRFSRIVVTVCQQNKNSAFCVLKKWVHSRIGQYGRPSVNTITLQRLIRLWWNFVHRTVLLISRSREEDENDWSTPSWFIAKNVVIPVGLFHGVPPKKNTSVFESTERYPILWSLKSCIFGKKISHQYRSFGKI